MDKDQGKKTLRVPLAGAHGWGEKPFAQRDPAHTCRTCYFASRERTGPADIAGQVVCKRGPKHVTSLPSAGGGAIGIAAFPAVRPEEWCHGYWPQDETPPGVYVIAPAVIAS